MLLWYLKGEGSSPHVVQGICSQIQSSQVSKSALPPIVQDRNAARQTIHDTDGMSGIERYNFAVHAQDFIGQYWCKYQTLLQSVKNSINGVLFDRLPNYQF